MKMFKDMGISWKKIIQNYLDIIGTLDRNGFITNVNEACESIVRQESKEMVGSHFKNFIHPEDITKTLEVVQDAMQELEKLSLVASKTTNGVLITDANKSIEWVNEGFTRLTGYTPSEVIGKNPSSFLHGEETNKATVQLIEENLKQGKSFTGEILNYKKSGEKVWILLDTTPVLNEVGEVVKFTSIQTDITERKEAEEYQLEMTNDLFRQNRDLQQFTYIVSHNLRSPVAGAVGLVELLADFDKNSEAFQKSLDYLKGSIYKIDTVLNDLNEILSARDRKDTTQEMVKLAPVCQQVIEEQQESLEKCKGDVSLDFEEGISVQGNKAYVYSIFHNLLSNALKYRSPERALKVNIQCFKNKDRDLIIAFSDNGLGFDMELVGENLFKLYKRFHTHIEGRGIGMFLVKSHVEAMGGTIEVESKVNVGTRFLIHFK